MNGTHFKILTYKKVFVENFENFDVRQGKKMSTRTLISNLTFEIRVCCNNQDYTLETTTKKKKHSTRVPIVVL